METRMHIRLHQLAVQASLVAITAMGLSGTVGAAEVTVDCDGPGPADFGTISDALAALSLEGPNTIFVLPGTCVENVVIDNRERLTIDAQALNIVPADSDQDVVTIRDSRSIVLRALSADNGNKNGFAISSSSGVRLEGNHANSNGSSGYLVEDHSNVSFFSHATGNVAVGLLVARGSFALVQGATLTGNGAEGIVCRDGSTCHLDGNVVIENNGGAGLAAVNSSLFRVVSATGPNSVQGNGSGILLAGISNAVLTGPNGNSVTGNNGPGIEVESISNLALLNTAVSNNTGPGVTVLRDSVAGIVDGFGTNTISNNGGANLVCDATSLIFGNLGGISKLDCKQIEREMGPPRPGMVN